MNSPRLTRMLLVLLLLSAATCALGLTRMKAARTAATTAVDDLRQVSVDLTGLRGSTSATQASNADIGTVIRAAAQDAGIGSALTGIEPGRSMGGQMPVVLRLELVPLRSIVTFVHTLDHGDPRIKADAIELSAADEQRWSATITLAVRSDR